MRIRLRAGVEGAEGGPVLLVLERLEGVDGVGSNSERTTVLKEALACSGA